MYTPHVLVLPLWIALLATSPAGPPVLSAPVRVQAGGKDIVPDHGHAAPWLHDMDGDGKRDLLVGQFGDGAMRVYRNVGTDRAPKFEGYTYLSAGGTKASVSYG